MKIKLSGLFKKVKTQDSSRDWKKKDKVIFERIMKGGPYVKF